MITLKQFLTQIADAIRYKDGTTSSINALDFPDRIRNIPTSDILQKDFLILDIFDDDLEEYLENIKQAEYDSIVEISVDITTVNTEIEFYYYSGVIYQLEYKSVTEAQIDIQLLTEA